MEQDFRIMRVKYTLEVNHLIVFPAKYEHKFYSTIIFYSKLHKNIHKYIKKMKINSSLFHLLKSALANPP